jgi:hypothetical protein
MNTENILYPEIPYIIDVDNIGVLGLCLVSEEQGIIMIDSKLQNPIRDVVIQHEVGHLLNKNDISLFQNAVSARNSNTYGFILNLIEDYRVENIVLPKYLNNIKTSPELHTVTNEGKIQKLIDTLFNNVENEYSYIKNEIQDNTKENIKLADKLWLEIDETPLFDLLEIIELISNDNLTGAGDEQSKEKTRSLNYYDSTCIKYAFDIKILATIIPKNKYALTSSFQGEINKKRLKELYCDSFKESQCRKNFLKRVKQDIKYDIFVVIDRSGSTFLYKEQIMDSTIILLEAINKNNLQNICIVECNGDKAIIVKEPSGTFDKTWFTPLADGGTPLGDCISEVNKRIQKPDKTIVIMITDGQAYDTDVFQKEITKLRTFEDIKLISLFISENDVYGSQDYFKLIPETIRTQPGKIWKDLMIMMGWIDN